MENQIPCKVNIQRKTKRYEICQNNLGWNYHCNLSIKTYKEENQTDDINEILIFSIVCNNRMLQYENI